MIVGGRISEGEEDGNRHEPEPVQSLLLLTKILNHSLHIAVMSVSNRTVETWNCAV
jgi:hypothetical protein